MSFHFMYIYIVNSFRHKERERKTHTLAKTQGRTKQNEKESCTRISHTIYRLLIAIARVL